jgi:hypothetical protein
MDKQYKLKEGDRVTYNPDMVKSMIPARAWEVVVEIVEVKGEGMYAIRPVKGYGSKIVPIQHLFYS